MKQNNGYNSGSKNINNKDKKASQPASQPSSQPTTKTQLYHNTYWQCYMVYNTHSTTTPIINIYVYNRGQWHPTYEFCDAFKEYKVSRNSHPEIERECLRDSFSCLHAFPLPLSLCLFTSSVYLFSSFFSSESKFSSPNLSVSHSYTIHRNEKRHALHPKQNQNKNWTYTSNEYREAAHESEQINSDSRYWFGISNEVVWNSIIRSFVCVCVCVISLFFLWFISRHCLVLTGRLLCCYCPIIALLMRWFKRCYR